VAEPVKQFQLLSDHIAALRQHSSQWMLSRIIVYVERNLGFEAEHHRHALRHLPNVHFRIDAKSNRVGVLTTQVIKHAMATLLNTLLREQRISVLSPIITQSKAVITRFKEQLHVYSYQFKDPSTTFGTQRCALSGKIGGMKDDIVMAFQLGIFFSDFDFKHGLTIG
jgi:hypothetical protein